MIFFKVSRESSKKFVIASTKLENKWIYYNLYMHKNIEDRKRHTLSWSVMESCWLVGARIIEPVADFSPNLANELWVVNHEYLLNGSVLTCSCINAQPHQTVADRLKLKMNWKKSNKLGTWEMGFMGWVLVHLGTTLPSARHVSQCKPESQSLFLMHFCPSWKLQKTGNRTNRVKNGWCRS